jgi:Catalytic LigB subunit of aromatic ring-opening dioxygenase
MARIVLGIGTSHSPLLVLKGDQWAIRAADDVSGRVPMHLRDGQRTTYAELQATIGDRYREVATHENFLRWSAAAQRALDRIAASIDAVNPDVIVIVGDDQGELYDPDDIPAVSLFYGEEFVMRPYTSTPGRLPWAGPDFWKGYSRDLPHRFPGSPKFASDLVERLIEGGIDIAASNKVPDPNRHGFGHAIGFVIERLFCGKRYPVVPVLLNTYYPPNTPTPRRCLEIGRQLRQAIDASSHNLRVAVIASGGLSHFICEEELDRSIIAALRTHDGEALAKIPAKGLIYGSSEIRNWICTAGAVAHLKWQWDEYIPVRRTPVGSGIGLAFMEWR